VIVQNTEVKGTGAPPNDDEKEWAGSTNSIYATHTIQMEEEDDDKDKKKGDADAKPEVGQQESKNAEHIIGFNKKHEKVNEFGESIADQSQFTQKDGSNADSTIR